MKSNDQIANEMIIQATDWVLYALCNSKGMSKSALFEPMSDSWDKDAFGMLLDTLVADGNIKTNNDQYHWVTDIYEEEVAA